MSRPTPKKFQIAFVVIGVLGVAEMAWKHSLMRPSNGLWWMWMAVVGVQCIGLGLALGWAVTEPKGSKMTPRQSATFAAVVFVALITRQAAQDNLGTQVTPPFLGLTLLCLSIGFFALPPPKARRREPAGIG